MKARVLLPFILVMSLLLASCAHAEQSKILAKYGGRVKVERLAKPVKHDWAYNTHALHLDDDVYYINDADAYYLIEALQVVRKDVEKHNLWHFGRGWWYDIGAKR